MDRKELLSRLNNLPDKDLRYFVYKFNSESPNNNESVKKDRNR